MSQSPITSTTPEALRAAIAEAVQVDAQQLQAAVGSIQVASSEHIQRADIGMIQAPVGHFAPAQIAQAIRPIQEPRLEHLFMQARAVEAHRHAQFDIALERRVGLADHLHQRTANLSHGQRRQLEVAVALTLAPKAFIMDEPMAGLGAEGSALLTRFLDGLRAQAPILLVEHDMDAVFALADRISVLVYGRVIATGTVADIRASREVREAYLGEEA